MALTRKFLTGLGIEDAAVQAIIEAHTEVTDALKEERDAYKTDAEKLPTVQKELDKLKAGKDEPSEWQKKYEKEHSDFEAYKTSIDTERAAKAKENAYSKLLKEAGVSEKLISRVLKVSDLSKTELNEDGTFKDADKLTEAIKTDWSDFITVEGHEGARTPNPPAGSGGTPDYENMSIEEYISARKKDKR